MNLLFSLPETLQEKIYEFDSTFYELFNMCMLELNLNFKQHNEINKMLRNFMRQKILFKYYVDQNYNYLLN